MSCKNLATKSQAEIDDWCSRTDSGVIYSAAKDVCTVTCRRCGDDGCYEKNNSQFYFKTKIDGTIVEKGCQFLANKKDVWSSDRFETVCNQEVPSGYENGNTVCPITCGSCA